MKTGPFILFCVLVALVATLWGFILAGGPQTFGQLLAYREFNQELLEKALTSGKKTTREEIQAQPETIREEIKFETPDKDTQRALIRLVLGGEEVSQTKVDEKVNELVAKILAADAKTELSGKTPTENDVREFLALLQYEDLEAG